MEYIKVRCNCETGRTCFGNIRDSSRSIAIRKHVMYLYQKWEARGLSTLKFYLHAFGKNKPLYGYLLQMVVLTSFTQPTDGVRHRQQNTMVYVNDNNLGKGTLYIAESRLSWIGEAGNGFSIEYPHISLHAISRDLSAFPQECLFLMLDTPLGDEDQNNGQEEDDDGNDSSRQETTEMRLVPDDRGMLDAMFHAMNACQALHPDPEDSFSDEDFFEDADDEIPMEEADSQMARLRIGNMDGRAHIGDRVVEGRVVGRLGGIFEYTASSTVALGMGEGTAALGMGGGNVVDMGGGTAVGMGGGTVVGMGGGTVAGMGEGTEAGTVGGLGGGTEMSTVAGTEAGMGVGMAVDNVEGTVRDIAEGTVRGTVEGMVRGNVEGTARGNVEGTVRGNVEGTVRGNVEGMVRGTVEGTALSIVAGMEEGTGEGMEEDISAYMGIRMARGDRSFFLGNTSHRDSSADSPVEHSPHMVLDSNFDDAEN